MACSNPVSACPRVFLADQVKENDGQEVAIPIPAKKSLQTDFRIGTFNWSRHKSSWKLFRKKDSEKKY